MPGSPAALLRAVPVSVPGMEPLDPIADAAVALAGADAVRGLLAAAATIPATGDPWLAPSADLATPPELELPPRDPR